MEKNNKNLMTVKQISKILKVSDDLIRNKIKEIFPEKMKIGKTTYLDEIEVTIVKQSIEKNPYLRQSSEVIKTELEKDLIIKQAIEFLNEKIENLKNQNNEMKKQIEQDKPKIEFYDKVLKSDYLFTVTQIAQDIGWSANKLNLFLEQNGIQYESRNQWILKAKYKDLGYVKSKTFIFTDSNNKEKIKLHTYWTSAGRKFIINMVNQLSINTGNNI